ncbi:MAG: hypothetical protein P8Y63_04725 [Deltaproteobacteria bacterium]|jgi:hypothetical protein
MSHTVRYFEKGLCRRALTANGLRWDMIIYIKNIHGNADNPADDIPEGWSLTQWINLEIQLNFPGKTSPYHPAA